MQNILKKFSNHKDIYVFLEGVTVRYPDWFDMIWFIYQQQYFYISYNDLHIQKETIGW